LATLNYSIHFILGRNRHQTLSGKPEALEAADNPLRLADAFVAAGYAKKTNAACKVLYD
jgi:hypothetical protein